MLIVFLTPPLCYLFPPQEPLRTRLLMPLPPRVISSSRLPQTLLPPSSSRCKPKSYRHRLSETSYRNYVSPRKLKFTGRKLEIPPRRSGRASSPPRRRKSNLLKLSTPVKIAFGLFRLLTRPSKFIASLFSLMMYLVYHRRLPTIHPGQLLFHLLLYGLMERVPSAQVFQLPLFSSPSRPEIDLLKSTLSTI